MRSGLSSYPLIRTQQHKHHQSGFTLIELVAFIVVSSLIMSTILLGAIAALRNAPNVQPQWIAIQTVRQCLEWYLDQRRLNGYTSITCPSAPTSAMCSAPAGFNVATNVSCTTWNGDNSYKTITVSVTGKASTSLSVQIGNY